MQPQFLFFDMGNVLLRFSHQRMVEQMARVAGTTPQRAWQILFDVGLEWAYERGELTREQFYGRFCEAAGVELPDIETLDAAGNDIFELNSPIVALVGKLVAAGYRLGVLSNTTPSHWNYCRNRFGALRTMFELPVMSYDLKAMKPDPGVYAAAAKLAGVPANRIFFTDDRAENVAAAIAAGWDAVQFESVSQLNAALRSRGIVLNY